eukprot:COSAG04_NODE_10232_length_794_cov_1.152518_1_plen_155_part_01
MRNTWSTSGVTVPSRSCFFKKFQVALDSIDIGADTVTLSSDASGISNGDVLRLVSASGQTCDAAPLESDLTVSDVAGAVLTFSMDLTDAGTGSETKCVVQRAFSAATECEPCPAGTYAAAGVTSCTACPAGQIDGDENSASECAECAAGTYEDGG